MYLHVRQKFLRLNLTFFLSTFLIFIRDYRLSCLPIVSSRCYAPAETRVTQNFTNNITHSSASLIFTKGVEILCQILDKAIRLILNEVKFWCAKCIKMRLKISPLSLARRWCDDYFVAFLGKYSIFNEIEHKLSHVQNKRKLAKIISKY